MSPELKECEAQALRLSLQDRAILAERLLASLDDIDEAEAERLWADEAERRYQAYKEGRITARPADEVFADARKMIR